VQKAAALLKSLPNIHEGDPPMTVTTEQPHSQTKAHQAGQEPKRQFVGFSFYRVQPEWRRLERSEKDEHRGEFTQVIQKWNQRDKFHTLTYSTVGMRPDCEMMLWRICYTADEIQMMTAEMLATRLGAYIETPHNFIAMTKRSQYLIGHEHEGQTDSRGTLCPGGQKYIFVYPFWKTRAWYLLPMEERQRMMSEHIRVGHEFPRVKLNTTYSFGLDDQEFVVAFETDYPADFLDLVEKLRGGEASAYTERETPIFTCVAGSVAEVLELLG
jgi:chlorite dismutase